MAGGQNGDKPGSAGRLGAFIGGCILLSLLALVLLLVARWTLGWPRAMRWFLASGTVLHSASGWAWPIAAITAVFVLREPLADLIQRIESWSWRGNKAKFYRSVSKDVANAMKRISELEAALPPTVTRTPAAAQPPLPPEPTGESSEATPGK